MTARRIWFGCLGLALLTVGCAEPEYIDVTGLVTYQGKPVPKGEVTFMPHDKSIADAAGMLNDGSFKLRTKPGKMKVSIEAVRPSGKFDAERKFEIDELYLPERYNEQSELEVEVTHDGDHHFEFHLTE
jgi:hypothetical protein